jgi:hypothetical protein
MIKAKPRREAASELGSERVSNGREHMSQLGSEHGVLGSRRVDGPTAAAGGKRAGANESTSFNVAHASDDARAREHRLAKRRFA